jgi:hypothetical protein
MAVRVRLMPEARKILDTKSTFSWAAHCKGTQQQQQAKITKF